MISLRKSRDAAVTTTDRTERGNIRGANESKEEKAQRRLEAAGRMRTLEERKIL